MRKRRLTHWLPATPRGSHDVRSGRRRLRSITNLVQNFRWSRRIALGRQCLAVRSLWLDRLKRLLFGSRGLAQGVKNTLGGEGHGKNAQGEIAGRGDRNRCIAAMDGM